MTPLNVGILALGLGICLGLVIAMLIWRPGRSGDPDGASLPAGRNSRSAGGPETAATPQEPVVPEGVKEVLSVLRAGAIVVDRSARVRTSTGTAIALGLVRGEDLLNARLRELATRVLGQSRIHEEELEVSRGPVGPGRILLRVRVAPFGDDLVLILVEDHTQARRVEEVRRDFVINVSHELKTPVGGLALLAEAVQGAADDPKAVERFAGRMKTETERLTRLVTEIVDLSRLQTNDVLADMVIVDVAACAAEAVEQTRLVAAGRTVIAAPAGPPGDLRIYGDAELITTAIRNLVTNAISYSEDGTQVNVVTRRTGDLVEVSVSDQGVGISPQDQVRIFERFYRIDPARSRLTGGTGLGLSIVKHICAGHGGEVSVWSEESQGSTFTLRLPAAVGDTRTVGSPAPHQLGHHRHTIEPAEDRPSASTRDTYPRQSQRKVNT